MLFRKFKIFSFLFALGLSLMSCVSSGSTRANQDKGLNRMDFKINYLYRANGIGEFKPFRNGSVLHSGDHYKLIFEPSINGYVYIFQIDSAHKIVRLFPTDNFFQASAENRNPVVKGQRYFVPAPHKSFKLDRQVGEETIYLVITPTPDAKLEALYKRMQARSNVDESSPERLRARVEWHNAITKLRAPELELMDDDQGSPPITWHEQGEQFSVLPQYLKNRCEECVYIVNFQHR